MEVLNDKIPGDSYFSNESNQVTSEIQNLITQTGISLTNTDLNQLNKAVANQISNGTFYKDIGTFNNYILNAIPNRQAPFEYRDGMTMEFIAQHTNTGNAIVNAGPGTKLITGTSNGGEITLGDRVTLKYRLNTDDVVIANSVKISKEVENVITGTGQVFTSSDFNQLGKGIAAYSANSSFYNDAGTVNTHVLTVIGLNQSPPIYIDGLTAEFIAANTNTGPSLVALPGLPVKNIVNTSSGNEIQVGNRYTLKYRLSSDDFEIVLINLSALRRFSPGHLKGMIISNNVTNPNTDIDISSGSTVDDNDTVDLELNSLITKEIDNTWATESAAGGLADSLTPVQTSTTYHIFILGKLDGTTDAGFDTSINGTNLLADAAVISAGFVTGRRIGFCITDSSANILRYQWIGDYCYWNEPVNEFTGTVTSAPSTKTFQNLPVGISVNYGVTITTSAPNATPSFMRIYNPDIPDISVTGQNSHIVQDASTGDSGQTLFHNLIINCNLLAQARLAAVVTANTNVSSVNIKYVIDTRGKE